jgi:elongation factor G
MKEYTTEFIRNVALVAHGSAGKTMMSEAFLHYTGATTRLGKIEDGTSVSDYDEEEIRRKISLYTSILPIEYKNIKINLLDAPGFPDFVGEVISALRIADGAMILVDAVSGLEVGTEIAWRYCDQFNLPRLLIINKMDRDNANFTKALASVSEGINARFVKIQLPWGEKAQFKGVIDLLKMKAFSGDGKTEAEIPLEYKEAAEIARSELMEAAAEGEDALLEKYLESGIIAWSD